MKVRQLIRALAKHDLDMEVVIPADPNLLADFVPVAGVEQDVFSPDRQEPAYLKLAERHGEGTLVAVKLSARPTAASH